MQVKSNSMVDPLSLDPLSLSIALHIDSGTLYEIMHRATFVRQS
jgi:hypothetical protein